MVPFLGVRFVVVNGGSVVLGNGSDLCGGQDDDTTTIRGAKQARVRDPVDTLRLAGMSIGKCLSRLPMLHIKFTFFWPCSSSSSLAMPLEVKTKQCQNLLNLLRGVRRLGCVLSPYAVLRGSPARLEYCRALLKLMRPLFSRDTTYPRPKAAITVLERVTITVFGWHHGTTHLVEGGLAGRQANRNELAAITSLPLCRCCATVSAPSSLLSQAVLDPPRFCLAGWRKQTNVDAAVCAAPR